MPEEGKLTNRELSPDLKFPPLLDESDEWLTSVLYTLGPAVGTGFGLSSISWSEMRAWCELTGTRLASWQAEGLVLMSRAYVGEYNEASRVTGSHAPWTDDEGEEKRQESVADTLRSGLRALKAN